MSEEKNDNLPILPENKTTTKDKVISWYISDEGEVELSENEEKQRLRWVKAYGLLCKGCSPFKAVPILMRVTGVSEAQAYRDIKNAISIFGDVQKSEKEGYRNILFEYAMKTYRLAAKKGNLREMNRAIGNMAMLKGLDRDDPDLPDFTLFQPHEVNIDVPHEVLELLQKMLSMGAVDVSAILKNQSEDIEHEEVD